ncbi:phage replisome organizer N-terminal domain-containing protein [Vagococcus fluvialis]|uniref:Replication protein n=1 Tax=Vagococcus fluvialis TaxID=2738 RepID=A0A7X6D7F7_9ENTE|nr:phage replisome organizer N-terminal domain-containing protein [Vagococcus fluvialis]NKC67207.1 replication protein [Vagococcus fluvialis]
MADMKWIKLATDIPDNMKIKRIRRLPDGNNVILFWVFLLARAGDSNSKGGLFISDRLPYTVEDLADDFNFSTEFVNFALITLEQNRMIEIYEDIIFIKNWEEYQSVDKFEKIREQTRIRVANHREKQKQLALENKCNVTCNADVTQSNATEEELEEELDKDIDKKNKKPKKHKYGEYKNVLLSDEELEKLKKEFPTDWKERIERLSEYIAMSGRKYKDFLAVIRNWAKKDKKKAGAKRDTGEYDNLF